MNIPLIAPAFAFVQALDVPYSVLTGYVLVLSFGDVRSDIVERRSPIGFPELCQAKFLYQAQLAAVSSLKKRPVRLWPCTRYLCESASSRTHFDVLYKWVPQLFGHTASWTPLEEYNPAAHSLVRLMQSAMQAQPEIIRQKTAIWL